jgi:succinoglycan biosynthesis transport protein ExoP
MTEPQKAGATPGLTVADVLYIIFKHKWKIVLCFALGVIGASVMPRFIHRKYGSEARLLIKYVVEKSPTQVAGANGSTVQQLDDSAQSILNTELQIITSMDLALQVADAIGPAKLLTKSRGGNDRNEAAGVIQDPKNLTTEVRKPGNVIGIEFQHQDPSIVQAVLKQLIESYKKQHAEIRRGGEFDKDYSQELEQLRGSLEKTEGELRETKARLGIVSLDAAKESYAKRISDLQDKIADTQVELAQHEASVNEMRSEAQRVVGATNLSSPITLAVATAGAVREYKRVCKVLETLEGNYNELSGQLTPEALQMKGLREQIAANEAIKAKLEKQNPGLIAMKPVELKGSSGDAILSSGPSIAEVAKGSALRSRMYVLTNQLADVETQVKLLAEAEPRITELERQRDREQGYFKNLSESLERAKINERLGAGKISNISVIQEPTPASPLRSKLKQMMAMMIAGGLGVGLGLAYLLEMFLDQSVKRPVDIEIKVQLPLFMTIPQLRINGKRTALGGKKIRLLSGPGQSSDSVNGVTSSALQRASKSSSAGDLAAWDPRHLLRPFSEALRDRLITYFEVKNLTHKPKLIAVTACGKNAGVSTVAAGLAASLSETGEGNVLLVDMNVENGSATHFRRGDLACDIDDALETQKRENAQVQDNLYVVTESSEGEQMPSILPKRFKNLVPKLKASDFDYIIFDMPPVSQISVTPRLAKFMDMVLMVAESEKTSVHVIKRAHALLSESKANVGLVLNKTRQYVPKLLQQEL